MVSSVRELDVYQKAYRLALDLHRLSHSFPKSEQYAMADQIRRASKGICANLAEGFAKGHKSAPEFRRYGLMAVGSAEEMMVWIDFCRDLGFLDEAQAKTFFDEYKIICRQLNSLIEKWN